MDWILVPSLVSLRAEFNTLAPKRDKASDGSIGDLAHQQESSDHNPDETGRTPYSDADNINEVHAIDVDSDLNKPGWDMTRCVQIIVTRHRTGKDDRLQNVIWNRTIWSRSWGWTARAYTGASPHTEHGHFSARYTTGQESDTRPWGLLEADVTRELEFQEFTASLPILKKGDQDGQYVNSHTGWVGRVQKLLAVTVDGDYGPETAAAVLALGLPGMTGNTIDITVWERLYGLWGAADRLAIQK